METDVYKEIGRRVAALRERKGLTQEALAEKASLSRSHVARVEGGGRQATVSALVSIAKALEVPLWRLFTDTRAGLEELETNRRVAEIAQVISGLRRADARLLLALAHRLSTEPPTMTLHERGERYGVDEPE